MQIMTRIGLVSREQLHQALQNDIHSVDGGIDISPLHTNWGSLVSLDRQGQATKWRVWFYSDGHSRITHLETASLPALDVTFQPGEHLKMRDYLLNLIEKGYI